jgi:hypothetical protein
MTTLEKTKTFAIRAVSYGTPVGITAVSAVALYNQVTLLVNILIPTAILLVYLMIWALLEIQRSRQEIKQLTLTLTENGKRNYPLPNKLRYQSGDPIENEDWYYLYNYSETARKFDELIHIISYKNGVNLSPAAKELLLIPILEQYQINGMLSEFEVEESLYTLIKTVKTNPSVNESENSTKRTTISIIKAYYNKFCSIPPFCSKKDKENENIENNII